MSFLPKIAGCLLLFSTSLTGPCAEVQVGDAFPALSLIGSSGAELAAATGKVAVVDFWASWCAPCKESFRSYAQIDSEYRSRGLFIVGVSVDEKQEAFDSFVKKLSPAFLVVRDKNQQLVRQVSVPAMPTCYLLGRDGRVRFIHRGFYGAETDRLIRKELDLLLSEKSPSP